jgi:hypothetical protein
MEGVDKVSLLPYYATDSREVQQAGNVQAGTNSGESSASEVPVATPMVPVAPGHNVKKIDQVKQAVRDLAGGGPISQVKVDDILTYMQQKWGTNPTDNKQYVATIKSKLRKQETELERAEEDKPLQEKLDSLPYKAFRPIQQLVNEHGRELVLAMLNEIAPEEASDEDE